MDDVNTTPYLKKQGHEFLFFRSHEKAWADHTFGKTQYLGPV